MLERGWRAAGSEADPGRDPLLRFCLSLRCP